MASLFPISTFFRVDASYQSPSARVQITCGVRRQEGTTGSHNLACLDLIRDGAGSLLQAFFFLIGSRSIYLESLPPLWPEYVFAMNAQAWTVKFEFLQTFAIVWFDMDAKF